MGTEPDDDPYVRLGIPTTASPREVAAAYRRLVRQLHPDVPGGDGELLAAVVAAYRLVRDRQCRAGDDRQRTYQGPANPNSARAARKDTGRTVHATSIPVRVHHGPDSPRRQPDLRAGPVLYHPH
ncbi:MAG TPA: J domain-containing protein [Pseudonocardia sp.]